MDISIGSDIDAFVREHVQYLREVSNNVELYGLSSDLGKVFKEGQKVKHYFKSDGEWLINCRNLYFAGQVLYPLPIKGVALKSRNDSFRNGGINFRFWSEDLTNANILTQISLIDQCWRICIDKSPRALLVPETGFYFQQNRLNNLSDGNLSFMNLEEHIFIS
jgi:hypothetical protein